jgi:hypothetical protein
VPPLGRDHPEPADPPRVAAHGEERERDRLAVVQRDRDRPRSMS